MVKPRRVVVWIAGVHAAANDGAIAIITVAVKPSVMNMAGAAFDHTLSESSQVCVGVRPWVAASDC